MPKLDVVRKSEWSIHEPARSPTLSMLQYLEHLPEIGEPFVSLRRLKLVGFPKLKRMPRLPGTLENLHIQQCKALVMTCSEDVNMIRSLFIETATQIEPSLNITATEVAEIDRFAGEQPDMFEKILCDISADVVACLVSLSVAI